MTNIGYGTIEEYQDIAAINGYKKVVNSGGDVDAYMTTLKFASRDNGRTPMQWNAAKNAGFTNGTPWLPVNDNYQQINVTHQEQDPHSVLTHFKKMTALRKNNPVLVYGAYTLLQPEHEEVYAYTRESDGKKLLVLLNFSEKESVITLEELGNIDHEHVVINNYDAADIEAASMRLKPYQAVIFSLN
jgi:oligo-1,6-glucosidase